MLALFRRLTALRREQPALSVGEYRSFDPTPETVFAYQRRHGKDRLLIALNFGGKEETIDISSAGPRGTVLLSTLLDREGRAELRRFRLRADEGVILRLA